MLPWLTVSIAAWNTDDDGTLLLDGAFIRRSIIIYRPIGLDQLTRVLWALPCRKRRIRDENRSRFIREAAGLGPASNAAVRQSRSYVREIPRTPLLHSSQWSQKVLSDEFATYFPVYDHHPSIVFLCILPHLHFPSKLLKMPTQRKYAGKKNMRANQMCKRKSARMQDCVSRQIEGLGFNTALASGSHDTATIDKASAFSPLATADNDSPSTQTSGLTFESWNNYEWFHRQFFNDERRLSNAKCQSRQALHRGW